MNSPVLTRLLRHHAVRGVAVGRCVDGSEISGRDGKIVGHAHTAMARHRGWICLASLSHLNATTIRHELAHLVCGDNDHDEGWRRMVRRLGGRVEVRYRRKDHIPHRRATATPDLPNVQILGKRVRERPKK